MTQVNENPNYLKETVEKWKDVLDDDTCEPLSQKAREVTAIVLENTVKESKDRASQLNEAVPSSSTGNVSNFDPVIIGLLRRAMPKLIHFDWMDIQPMTLPTGLVFTARNRYNSATGAEALFNEADSGFSAGNALDANKGDNPVGGIDGLGPWDTTPGFSNPGGVATAQGEDFGAGTTLNQMTFTIDKHVIVAKERGLQAGYTVELAQDLKAVHGLDAEQELSNLLSDQIITEMNREGVRTMYSVAKIGAQLGTVTPGTFDLDTDSNGRWMQERFLGLRFQIEREANAIAQETRMGKGNLIMCSADVASALAMSGELVTGKLGKGENLTVDDTGATFVGVLNGQFKVYVDPYMANGSASQFCLVGFKGNGLGKAGMIYSPYTPLTKYTVMDPDTFQPKIAYKARYGISGNPLNGSNIADPAPAFTLASQSNAFFRLFRIQNLS